MKQTTAAALAGLANEGVRVVMLTGDNRSTAEPVARRLGITEVEAEVMPEDKQRIIEKLKREGRRVPGFVYQFPLITTHAPNCAIRGT